MSEPATRPMSADEFLAWERRQEIRHEFDGIAPRAMTGGTAAHSIIEINLTAELGACLRGTPCRVYSGTMKVQIGVKHRYPDATVTCEPVEPTSILIPAPVVIFEIISNDSQRRDRKDKLAEYCSLPSLRRYVILEQDEASATIVARTDHGWSIEQRGPGETLAMPEIGADLPMAAIYAGLDLSGPNEEDSA